MKKHTGELHFEEVLDTDKDGNSLTLMDIIPDNDKTFEKVDTIIKSKQLYEFLNVVLTKREAEIIKLRYGLYGKRSFTQREIAKKLNISRSYVSRIEKRALEKLKSKFK